MERKTNVRKITVSSKNKEIKITGRLWRKKRCLHSDTCMHFDIYRTNTDIQTQTHPQTWRLMQQNSNSWSSTANIITVAVVGLSGEGVCGLTLPLIAHSELASGQTRSRGVCAMLLLAQQHVTKRQMRPKDQQQKTCQFWPDGSLIITFIWPGKNLAEIYNLFFKRVLAR